MVNYELSEERKVKEGICQGSMLSHLFEIVVNVVTEFARESTK